MKPDALTRQRRERRIADIIAHLRPHKRGVDEVAMEAEIRAVVENTLAGAAVMKPWNAAAKKRAARAAEDLAALEQYLPAFVEFGDFAGVTLFG